MIVETKHEVSAVEVETPVFRSTVALGGTVGTFIAEEADMGNKAELLTEVECNTGTETDLVGHGCVAVGSPIPNPTPPSTKRSTMPERKYVARA